jgi:hypothetical protein
MTVPEFADKAGRAFRTYLETLAPEPVAAGDRDLAIVALQQAIGRKAQLRRRNRYLLIAASAASIAAGASGLFWARSFIATGASLANVRELQGTGHVAMASGTRDLALGAVLPEGATLSVSADSEARFAYGSGTTVVVRDGADLTLVTQGNHKVFGLSKGSFAAQVAKLKAGERFLVRTADAEVEVRGTAFKVRIVAPDSACGEGTPTRLDVSEGVVVIRHHGQEARIAAGESWPECKVAEVTEPAMPALAARTGSSAASRPALPAQPAGQLPGSGKASASTLGSQNDLFAEAMQRKRTGDVQGAVAALDRLMASYPAGIHAESAAAEKLKLLRTRTAAEEYLRKYPHGFAQKDAEAILANK